MRCREVSRTRTYNAESKHSGHDTTVCQEKGKEDNSATALNKRLSAQQSATSARQELNIFCILRDSQNIPPVHLFTRAHASNTFLYPLSLFEHSTFCWFTDSWNSQFLSREFQSLCIPYPRTPPRRTESWRIGDGDLTFDASKTRIV